MSIENSDTKGGTPLHWAAYLGSYYTTSLLCALNVNLNIQDCEGETPLHLATISGNSRVGRILLLKGAKKDLRDKKGRSPLDIAASKNSVDFKEMLKEPSVLEIYGYRPLLRPYKRNYLPFGTLIGMVVICFVLLSWFCFPCKNYLDSKVTAYLYSFSSFFTVILVIILLNLNPGYVESEKQHTLSVPSI